MIKVTIIHPITHTSDVRYYPYSHTARSWLLLWGFLPSSNSDYHYINYISGATATLTVLENKQ